MKPSLVVQTSVKAALLTMQPAAAGAPAAEHLSTCARMSKKTLQCVGAVTTDFMKGLAYHAYSLWLFTRSDLKTIVGPSFVFGLTNALAASEYGILEGLHIADLGEHVAHRALLALLWIWLQLLPFTMNNQISPEAIAEDRINKPWRPMPSKRMTAAQASRVMVFLNIIGVTISFFIGGVRQAVAGVFLGVWYNNFAGGDCSFVIRNIINVAGYVCFTSGAMEVTLGQLPYAPRLACWFAMIGGIIFSTVHMQDMYDQEGDSMRGRKTVPLVIGDAPARYMATVFILAWSGACTTFWGVGLPIRLLSISLALIISGRCLRYRGVDDDKKTFRIWNLWMALTFVLPLLRYSGW